METPDSWIVLKITKGTDKPIYKVFASWRGGYTDSDYWQMNSGIVKVEEDENYFSFYGHSGSCYQCHKKGYGTIPYSQGVLNQMIKNVGKVGAVMEEMDMDTDWSSLSYV